MRLSTKYSKKWNVLLWRRPRARNTPDGQQLSEIAEEAAPGVGDVTAIIHLSEDDSMMIKSPGTSKLELSLQLNHSWCVILSDAA